MAALSIKTTEGLDITKQTREAKPKNTGGKDSTGTLIGGGKVASGSRMQNDYLEARSQRPPKRHHTAKVKQSELILFTTQLSVMLDSGVVLSDALDAIAEQAEQGTFRVIVMDVAETVAI